MVITPDEIKIFSIGPVTVNGTIFFTWIVMAVLVIGSWLVTRKLTSDINISRGQNMLEVLVQGMRTQISEIARSNPDLYLPYIGTFFLFIVVSNIMAIIPYFHPPTGSLSTSSALAASVFIMVPVFGIMKEGVHKYFKHYAEPTIIMVPLHIISELSRTLALAVRLFGNVMSGALIVALILAIIPFFIPVFMHALGLLTGIVQAYIFAVLAMVYIASSMEAREREVAKFQKNV